MENKTGQSAVDNIHANLGDVWSNIFGNGAYGLEHWNVSEIHLRLIIMKYDTERSSLHCYKTEINNFKILGKEMH